MLCNSEPELWFSGKTFVAIVKALYLISGLLAQLNFEDFYLNNFMNYVLQL